MSAKRPACRFCGSTEGALRPVALNGDVFRTMTRQHRSDMSRLARLDNLHEHAACLDSAESDRLAQIDSRQAMAAEARRLRESGDVEGFLRLVDAMDAL